ncbi:beta-ribofuranosylaminobenzene 5'-phosphate synthase family protein [Halapricum hydrolyticum]|uniref:Beta-ribofuranosylaminobenzene 5'-phosphate synthase n=1 Tax=Halapricum hydrolyticum TaxID=2979991 RepID=A0AAE3LE02_9EURY|nr:beta-ribofuranosylaminobenzene 5'-phosphate synthase family protein [Halapricum hydrolyticum]MCU4716559.1 GHMP kinase [Halapricum hydrolyticum]MCU4725836.1 GHMP kinase [Halapricum hydrolyticum]
MTRVTVGGRIHFGFQNLSLAHDRLYGGVGVGLSEPRLVLTAQPADDVSCDWPAVAAYVARAVDVLGVPGADVTVEQRLPRHVGFGSGTRLALASLVAVARAYDRSVDVRDVAPDLGRGGRSGVGIATFEAGGFVVDAGHPTELFTSAPPAEGEWTVPPVVARHDVPGTWRFLLVTPDVERGRSGDPEDASIRSVVERADPGIADDIALVLTRQLLPAIATGDYETFGRAVARLSRLNGAWYADEQGGVYRPPAGRLIDALDSIPGISGAGQSSWGPTVYGITHASTADTAERMARDALADLGLDGTVRLVEAATTGASVD